MRVIIAVFISSLVSAIGAIGGAHWLATRRHNSVQDDKKISDVLKAREFVLVDSGGKCRGRLHVDPDGASIVSLCDSNGATRIFMFVSANNLPGVTMFDAKGEKKGELFVARGDAPGFALWDAKGKKRVVLGVTPGDQPGFTMTDEEGSPRIALAVQKDGASATLMAGELRQSVMISDRGNIILYDDSGQETCRLPR